MRHGQKVIESGGIWQLLMILTKINAKFDEPLIIEMEDLE